MSIFEALIQGIVQGLSEFLPISSSGHLSLLQYFFGISGEAAASYSILLHFGTLVAVFAAFYKTIWALILEFFKMVKDIFTRKFSIKNASPERRMVLLLIVSEVPLLFFYFLSDFYTELSADNDIVVEGLCFLLTSVLLFISDRVVKGKKTAADMSFKDALVIGTVQGIAPLPGLSRSGSTISTWIAVSAIVPDGINGLPKSRSCRTKSPVWKLKSEKTNRILLQPMIFSVTSALGIILQPLMPVTGKSAASWNVS